MDKKTGKSRGYGFVTFDSERAFKDAYHEANGRRFEGRQILVDIERSRIKKDWYPRRLGGGKGLTRKQNKVEELLKSVK